ncbi:uncharacterized protein DS421_4g124570 [Arachis hypogaea]|nr:uncharacterized protein DS421_4g124570 [Arachis hypogaea]
MLSRGGRGVIGVVEQKRCWRKLVINVADLRLRCKAEVEAAVKLAASSEQNSERKSEQWQQRKKVSNDSDERR